jgi:hypothetical protein
LSLPSRAHGATGNHRGIHRHPGGKLAQAKKGDEVGLGIARISALRLAYHSRDAASIHGSVKRRGRRADLVEWDRRIAA